MESSKGFFRGSHGSYGQVDIPLTPLARRRKEAASPAFGSILAEDIEVPCLERVLGGKWSI